MPGETLRVDLLGCDLAIYGSGGQLACCAHDLVAAAIVEGNQQRQLRIARGEGLRLHEQVANIGLQACAIAKDPDPDAVLMQFGQIAADEQFQQSHQVRDFGLRP